MSLVTSTDSQRYAVGYKAAVLANFAQRFLNGPNELTSAQAAPIETAINALLTALAAAGYGGGGSTGPSDGDSVAITNSAGGDSHSGTLVVTDGAVVSAKLTADTTAIVDHTDATQLRRYDGSVIGSGITTASARVASGLLANVRLPANADAVINGMSVNILDSGGATTGTGTVVVGSNGALTGITVA